MKEIIIAIIGSGAFSAAVSGLIAFINGNRKSKKGNDDLIMFLSASTLYTLGESSLHEGEITLRKLELFNDMYDRYKKKGGNGYAEVIKERVNKLPIKIDED